jgi:hypothetical protein
MALAAVAGVAVGSIGSLAVGNDRAADSPQSTSASGVVELPVPTTEALALVAKVPVPTAPMLLVWTPGRVPDPLVTAARSTGGVTNVSVVKGATVDLAGSSTADGAPVDQPPPGMAIPLDAIAITPDTYAPLLPAADRAPFETLADGQALLGETSAALRRLGPGGRLRLTTGHELLVAGVVDDELVGAAEIVVNDATGAAIGVTGPRYVLLTHEGDRAGVEDRLRAALAPSTPVRFRAPGETPFLRAGDAVLPQALIKATFGEFAYRRHSSGRNVDQDPAWTAANIVTAEVPVLGTIRCHRLLVPLVERALRELEAEGLASLVDPAAFAGCWNPRLIDEGAGLSRHAWGAALDVNYAANTTGLGSTQDPRLVAAMARHGLTSGATWLVPDPAHFEYLGP